MIKVRCPTCNKVMQGKGTADWPYFPFCCERCRLIDLGRWLGEKYRIPPETEGEVPAQRDDDEIP